MPNETKPRKREWVFPFPTYIAIISEMKKEVNNESLTPEVIKDIRIKAGLTQREFAKQLGTRQKTIYEWEKGVKPNSKSRKKIIEFVIEHKLYLA